MSQSPDPLGLFFVGKGILLVLTSVLLVIPVVTRERAVLHRRGVMYYGLSILIYSTAWIFIVMIYFRIMTSPSFITAAHLLTIIAGALHLAGMWEFARGFINFGPREPPEVTEGSGGFEDADR